MEKLHICENVNCNHSSHSEKKFQEFVHIHLHTSQSTLDGCGKIQDYIQLAKEFGHQAIAITDHGNPAGIYDFFREVKSAGLKPILGEEFYFTTNLENKTPNRVRSLEERDKHQTVLIKNLQGYKNYCKLTYLSFTEGFYYKPRISYEMLFENKKGLIVTSGCAASMFNQLINAGEILQAERWFRRFVEEFGDDFYGEIQFNEICDKDKFGMDQKEMNDFIIRMCEKYGVKILIGGDVHYAKPEDAKLQDIVINCQRRRSTTATTENQESFIHARHLYYQSSKDFHEFNRKFGYNYPEKLLDQAFENSIEIKNKVDFEFETGKVNFPKFQHETIKDKTSDELLFNLAEEGLFNKLQIRIDRGEKISNELIDQYKNRLELELRVIKEKQIADYFLIVQDVISWAKREGIETGVARGSVGGSLTAYAIDIAGIDPIKFGLYFERFINPQRTAMPDIDCDFMNGTRERVREYLENKYGKDSVFGVVTFQQYKAKQALKDASRGLGRDTSHSSVLEREITQLSVQVERYRNRRSVMTDEGDSPIVREQETSLEEAKNLTAFFEAVVNDPKTTATVLDWIASNQDTIKYADKLLGQVRQLGTHAGGILITPGPVYNYIPVTRGSGEVVTAFKEADGSSKDLSELGLLKLDILGLKTLNVIRSCIDQIKNDLGIDITQDIQHLNLEDPKLFDLVTKGNVYGIFQMDGGASDLIKSIKPTCFEDMVAINALNRPGPKETFGPVFGKWKRLWNNGEADQCKNDEVYPRLDFMIEATRETYGCLIFQEQFMFMVSNAADLNLGEADNFRRAIAWREDNPKYHTVKKYFDKLASSMIAKGYKQQDVDYFVEYCRKFMGYSFNKAHAVGYAYIAMQTLYLKAYYPAYFFANLFNVEIHENYQEILSDAIANGVEILSPSITKSKYDFTVEGNALRIGLRALKGFGEAAYDELQTLEASQCVSLYDLLALPFKKVNSKAFEVLIDAGTFDEFGVEREKIHLVRDLYKDKKIEKWFTRKRKALDVETMPESLINFPEKVVLETARMIFSEGKQNVAQHLIGALIPYIKVNKRKTENERNEREEEILGFSLSLAHKLNQLINLANRYPELSLKSLSAHKNEFDLCYWYLINKTTAKTKKGKPYLILEISDKGTNVRAKCWDMVPVTKGKAYVSHLKKDKYGYTILNDGYLTEVTLE